MDPVTSQSHGQSPHAAIPLSIQSAFEIKPQSTLLSEPPQYQPSVSQLDVLRIIRTQYRQLWLQKWKFHSVSRLPPEIRFMIWEQCWTSKYKQSPLSCHTISKFGSKHYIRYFQIWSPLDFPEFRVFKACLESRHTFLRIYVKDFLEVQSVAIAQNSPEFRNHRIQRHVWHAQPPKLQLHGNGNMSIIIHSVDNNWPRLYLEVAKKQRMKRSHFSGRKSSFQNIPPISCKDCDKSSWYIAMYWL